MWLHTDNAYVSIVAHTDRSDDLLVRARTRADLTNFGVPDDAIWADAEADYPWRAVMPRTWVGERLTAHATSMQYPNVKDAVKDAVGAERAGTLMQVWAVLRRLESEEPDSVIEADYARRGVPLPDRWTGVHPVGLFDGSPYDDLDAGFTW